MRLQGFFGYVNKVVYLITFKGFAFVRISEYKTVGYYKCLLEAQSSKFTRHTA